MQRYWFLDVMDSKQRSKARTVSCVLWAVRGLLQRTVTFLDPKVRVPMCVNAAAARSYLLRITRITDLVLAGRTKAQMEETMAAAIEKKELPPMEPGAMCYMMSKEGYGGDSIPHWPSHLMFFFSDIDPAVWGANLPDSPIVGIADPLEHLTQFVIPTQLWSDGTEDLQASPTHVHQ